MSLDLQKLIKLFTKAENAKSRKKAQKILKKVEKLKSQPEPLDELAQGWFTRGSL